MERQGYLIQFDAQRKTPRWVAYHIKPEFVNPPDRTISKWGKFRDDPGIQGESTETEYKNQFRTWRNYAKGHLVPYYISGGDRDGDGASASEDEDDAKTVYEIMYMSNMAPQHHNNFNGVGGLWYKLETFVRDELLKKQKREVWVFAGCIYGPGQYDKIGETEVPPMFWKIVITLADNKPKVLAFLFPHQIKKHGDIDDYLVSIDLLEAMTGLDFFPDLSEGIIVEHQSTWENWKNY